MVAIRLPVNTRARIRRWLLGWGGFVSLLIKKQLDYIFFTQKTGKRCIFVCELS